MKILVCELFISVDSCLKNVHRFSPFFFVHEKGMVKLFDAANENGHEVHIKQYKNIDIALQRYDEKYNCTLL